MTTAALHKTAHDPGDPIITSHCPFCGSGQVVGRSDGTIECGFCGMNYIVRVQPAFPGMPQGPGMGPGAPTDAGPELMGADEVGPDGMPLDAEDEGFPPDAEEDMPLEDDGEEDALPFGDEDGEEEEAGPPAGDEEDSGPPPKKDKGGKKPPGKNKKSSALAAPEPSYRTAAGDVLGEDAYIRHLAVVCSGGSPAVLARLRAEASQRQAG